MKKIYLLLLIGTLFILPFLSNAQNDPIIRCAADEYHEEQMQDPEYAQKFRAIQQLVREQLQYRTPSCVTPIIIPIAIHFNGGITSANMTCIQDIVDDQIAVLNADFGGYNTDISNYCNHASNCPTEYAPTALGGGTCIQFCLATMDHPAGSGLSNGASAFTFGQYDFDSGAGPWTGYLNFFVSNVPPNGYSNTLLGVAPLFGGANPDGNGVFITASAFGGNGYSCTSGIALNNSGNYNLGRTVTHEVGHYYGLLHVFAGCSNGDGIADTPDQETDNGGVPTINYGTCISTAVNSCGTQDFFFNYMDYVYDVSMYMFTSDQSDLMNTTATTGVNHGTNPYKASATTCTNIPNNYNPTYPTGCPAIAAPESIFSTTATPPYEFCPAMNEMNFTDESTGFPTSWAWTFSGAGVSPTTSTSQNPTIQVNSTGTLTVTLTTSNNAGADPTPATTNYSIVILTALNCGDCGNTFVDSGGAGGNYANNEDMTWTFCTADVNDVVVVDFSAIDIGTASFEDIILVKYGSTAATSTGNSDFIVMLSNVYVDQGGGSYINTSSKITSTMPCMTFRFISNGSGTTAGWEAVISCIVAPTCNDGIQNQDETFVDCGGAVCNTCPTACQGFTFYDAGGASNTTGTDTKTWQICADAGENTIVNFTTIDMIPFNNGVLRVYDAVDNSGNWDYYISGSSISANDGSNGLSFYGSNQITSTAECLFFEFFNGSTGNGWEASVTCTAPLPLSLTAFNAHTEESNVLLNWTTQNEVNVDKFILQRRSDISAKFIDIVSIDACGNCLNETIYSFTDEDLKGRMTYTYRLKMMDIDDQYVFSNLINAKVEDNTNNWSIYPNPGKGAFTVQLTKKHQVKSIVLIDKLGRTVYKSSINSNDTYITLDLYELPHGVYQVILIGNSISLKSLVIMP